MKHKGRIICETRTADVNLALLNTAIVILGRGFSPGMLHPLFLAKEGIVPAEWEIAEAPVCTPKVSIVKYGNGIAILLDETKLMVHDDSQKETSMIAEVTGNITAKLPQVQFSAVGINFGAFFECADPGNWIADRFLNKGPWNTADLVPKVAGVKLIYPADGADLNLNCDAGMVQKPGDPISHDAVLVIANYHAPITGEGAVSGRDQALHAVGLYGKRVADFREKANIIFG